MKLRHPIVFIAVLLVVLSVHALHAQDSVIEADVFWLRLEQTRLLLEQATVQTGTDQTAAIDQIQGLWQSVDRVRLTDETVIAVDLAWLTRDLSTDENSLRVLQNRVDALLDYRASLSPRFINTIQQSLNALERVLQDPRFQYPETLVPTPLPTVEAPPESQQDQQRDTSPGISLPSPGLSQVLLFAVGAIIVGALVVYLMQGLQIQHIAVVEAGEPGEDPPTADAARDLAASSASIRDYRVAIRYLYLSILLRLDERGLIHYNPTLTNTEHLRQITDQPELLRLLNPVVHIFDDVWYGFKPVDEALYQQFREKIDQLQRMAS